MERFTPAFRQISFTVIASNSFCSSKSSRASSMSEAVYLYLLSFLFICIYSSVIVLAGAIMSAAYFFFELSSIFLQIT